MFGSTGGLAEFRAVLMASRGFACFALAYLRCDDLPTSLADIDFDYFLDAVDWLASHPSVQPGGIGVVGTSKGGELAFLLGMATDQVSEFSRLRTSNVNIPSAASIGEGSVVPRCIQLDDLYKSGRDFWKGFENQILLHQAWTNNAKILYLCGEDDGVWRTDFANTFIGTCPEEKRKNIELIIYPGTGHLIEPPYVPVFTSWNNKTLGVDPGVSKDPLLRKRDVTTPFVLKLSVIDDHVPFADFHMATTVVLASDRLERWYKHNTVRRIVVREGSLRGTLFLPAE
ncbi:acyl-coenzyme A thioesterase 1-like [Haliotis rubra]|uniref:acyl-coenzyme A thioesterase 1-like n=1 Tax=Haliotis rubra TaxID=36100 RepID=UPI001EE61778|nr:acyl-coenzyme A thioesterase 1-like [Haliotis rubra]